LSWRTFSFDDFFLFLIYPMPRFEHIRHKPPKSLAEPREILLVSCPLRSNVNLSRMVRLAGCSGISQIVHCGAGKVDREIARDAADTVTITSPRSLPPVLDRLRSEGYRCVGLEQTTNSQLLYDYRFVRKTALVIGSEREGLPQEILDRLDDVVEIPVYGMPASFNVVTATTMAVYEYCRQFPDG
jgi:tRNA G18 (ribose-2'-O)-methylase SpoU